MKKILAGLMLMASVGSAHAVLTSTQALSFNPCFPGGLCAFTQKFRPSSVAAGQAFSDIYTFTFNAGDFVPATTLTAGEATATISLAWPLPLNANTADGFFSQVNFYHDLGAVGAGGGDVLIGTSLLAGPVAFPEAVLTSGQNYYLEIQGTYNASPANTFTRYDVSAQITAVPEPSEWALMLSGLGLMGFVARRRRAVSEAA